MRPAHVADSNANLIHEGLATQFQAEAPNKPAKAVVGGFAFLKLWGCWCWCWCRLCRRRWRAGFTAFAALPPPTAAKFIVTGSWSARGKVAVAFTARVVQRRTFVWAGTTFAWGNAAFGTRLAGSCSTAMHSFRTMPMFLARRPGKGLTCSAAASGWTARKQCCGEQQRQPTMRNMARARHHRCARARGTKFSSAHRLIFLNKKRFVNFFLLL